MTCHGRYTTAGRAPGPTGVTDAAPGRPRRTDVVRGPRGSRPTAAELEVWRGFIETATALRARVDRALQDDTGVSASDYPVLLALAEADGRRLRTAELAATVHWERSRLSHQVTRMEARGLVRRQRTDDDGRGSEVHLSPAGLDALRDAAGPHLRSIKALFVDALDADQQAALASAMRALAAHLDGPGPPGGGGG